MSGFYVKAEYPQVITGDTWVRNSDWINLPEINAGDKQMYGIFAVYEGRDTSNYLGINLVGSSTSTIYWGDGTSQVATSNTQYEKQYVYSATTGNVSVDSLDRNYKQVLVNIVFSGNVTGIYLDRGTIRGKVINWLDVIVDCSTATILRTSNIRKAVYMERYRVLQNSVQNMGSTDQQMTSLRIFDHDLSAATSLASAFIYIGNPIKSNSSFLSINSDSCSSLASAYQYSTIKNFGDVNSILSSNILSTFGYCVNLETVGDINLPVCTSMSSAFLWCASLESVGTINTPSVTTLTNTFLGCGKLKSVIFTECSGVTTTTSAFGNCYGLSELIMPNLTVGVNISACSMRSAELDTFFTSAGTASGSQTITITNNPGAATCNTSIATGKGFTVVG